MTVVPQVNGRSHDGGHMVVCGDDALAHRIAVELADVYRRAVTLVVPPPAGFEGVAGQPTSLSRASALLGRMSAAVGRPGGLPGDVAQGAGVRETTAVVPDEQTLSEAGVARAEALALLYEDDEANMRAAFLARRLNPRIRLVLRMYNRNLGRRMADLLDQATDLTVPETVRGRHDTSTTVLSDADTTAPAELERILAVLGRLLTARETVLAVNEEYIASAARDDASRTAPPFRLQGSYRTMNRIAARISPAMNDAELAAVIDDHYTAEARTLTGGAEADLLRLAELRGTLTPEQAARRAEVSAAYVRARALGGPGSGAGSGSGSGDEPLARAVAVLGLLADRVAAVEAAIDRAADPGNPPRTPRHP